MISFYMEFTANQVVTKMLAGPRGGKRLFVYLRIAYSATESELEKCYWSP